ncbi:MAG: polysaccharide deacetylase family protein [Clostridia bacterium]|nr:polysaccharide deacetylase family protein [Clostridia bacterium]
MKTFFKKTTVFLLIIAVSFIFSLSLLVKNSNASAVYFNGTTRKVPIYSVDRSDNKISISFDCAYGADYTYKLLDILDEYEVKCTFFVVKFWADKFPEVLKEISTRGHEIGSHSSTHPNMSKLSESQMISELTISSQTITEITGKKVELFRPPYGDYNNKLIEVSKRLNLYTIQWDVDSIDWKDISSKEIVNRVVKKTKSGSIILCHNNGLHTHEALPYILSNLKEKGFTFVPIGELIYKDNYTIDSFGVQHQALN